MLVLKVFTNQDGMMVIEHLNTQNSDHKDTFRFKKKLRGSIFSFFEIESEDDDETRNFFESRRRAKYSGFATY
jgi:hypothetical protein